MKYDVTGMQLATTTVLSCRHAGAAIALPCRHAGGGGGGWGKSANERYAASGPAGVREIHYGRQ